MRGKRAGLPEPVQSPRAIRFGSYMLDPSSGELHKNGSRIRLPDQPFQILQLLLQRPGEVVTREELRQRLWSGDTFVDFENGLNGAVKKLRDVLGDSAEHPRFVETLPRRGYRFIYPVETAAAETSHSPAVRHRFWMASVVLFTVLVALLGFNIGGLRDGLFARHAPQRIRSLAVLPLKNFSGDHEQEYFVDGMTDALITELGKIRALRIISLQSVLRFRDTKKSVPEIARELQVDAVIEGSVSLAGDQVRITAQLVQAEPERHLWAQSFSRGMRDVLQLQGEVAQAVAREIQVVLTPEQRARIATTRPINPEAYQAWLRGQQMYDRFSDEWFDSAAEYLQKASRLDPNFAPPYATLALVYCSDMRSSHDVLYPLAASAASSALVLDDSLAEAHSAQGLVNLRFRWDWAGAEREFKRAIELNPNSSEAHSDLGYFLVLMGWFAEGIAAYKRAIALDPLNHLPNERLGWAYLKAKRHDEAIAVFRELKRLEPDSFMVGYGLAHAYAHKRMYAEALTEVERVRCDGLDCGWVLAVTGKRKQARRLIDQLIAQSKRKYVDPGFIALTYVGLGENDKALEWLEMGYSMRARWMIYLNVIQELDPLRADPRFQGLLSRMNFPQARGSSLTSVPPSNR